MLTFRDEPFRDAAVFKLEVPKRELLHSEGI